MLVSKGRWLGFLHGMFQQIILGLDIHKMLPWSCEASFYLMQSIRIFYHWFYMVLLTLQQTAMHTDRKSVLKPPCQCCASSTDRVCVCLLCLSLCLTLITALSKYVSHLIQHFQSMSDTYHSIFKVCLTLTTACSQYNLQLYGWLFGRQFKQSKHAVRSRAATHNAEVHAYITGCTLSDH